MKRMEQFRGHFYNWYGTSDLRPLDPKYVSSVDSGNLAGHLIALGNACREMITRPVVDRQWLKGVEDSIALVRESLGAMHADRRSHTVTPKQLEEVLDSMAPLIPSHPQTVVELRAWLDELAAGSDSITDIARTLTLVRTDPAVADVLAWAEALQACIRSHRRDVELLKPWASRAASGDVAESMPMLGDLADIYSDLASRDSTLDQDALARASDAAKALERRLTELAATAGKMLDAMKFGFLLDPARQLLSIGYRVTDGNLDSNCYDLLASEARLASFVAIAKGEIPARHWFRLGRQMTPVDRGSALISWSGSMFEYLMPSLVMRAPSGSLLEQTSRLVVRRQMNYGTELGMPWGISESAYNARDLELTYQYSNFGVPGLGLKRGLSENAVIAPYATALAAMVDPGAAATNFSALLKAGGLGHFGWYEALDYTPSRVPEGETVAIVRAYMAHHQGMTLVALADALNDGAMRARFHAEPIIKATELLLQERTPRDVAVARPRAEEVKAEANVRESAPPTIRRFHSPHDLIPRTHLLSNGKYTVMITAAGSGFSRWGEHGGHAMARGRDLRFVGVVHFRARRAERQGLVGGFSTGGGRGGQLRSRVLRGSRGNRAARRHHDDDARSGSLAGGRRRSPPRLDHESRQPRARSRGDLVRRNRAGDGGIRHRPSGILQDVRADGVRQRDRRDSGHAAAALADRSAGLGGASGGG